MTTLENDRIPSSIVPMILYKIKEHLETSLVFDIPDSTATRAMLVKIGRFSDNPLDNPIRVAISSGDFEDPSYLDGRIDNPKFDNLKIPGLPVGEIGGGVYWWRRGSIDYQLYFVRQRLPEEVTIQYAYEFQSRLIKAVESTPIGRLRDDCNEQAFAPIYVESVSLFESGGGNQRLWRGKLLWRILTWRP